MANDLNQCTFIGRAGKDPELRYMTNGKAVLNISIAIGESWKTDGERQEKTTWVPLVMYDKLAEIAGEYVKKGGQIMVSGKLSVRKWQNKEGTDQYTTEIVCDKMQLLGGKSQQDEEPQRPARSAPPARKPSAPGEAKSYGSAGDDFDGAPF